MKMLIVDVYQAVPLYEMFTDHFYIHIDELAYFIIPAYLYHQNVHLLPRHIVNDYPFNLNTLSNEIINNT